MIIGALSIFMWLDGLVDLIQSFIVAKAVLAPLLLLFIEEAGLPLPVPGDMIIAFTGYRLSIKPDSPALWQAFVAAQVAALLGATILFFLSRRWGHWIVVKLGHFIFLEEEQIKKAEHLFARFGIFGIIIGRHIPGLRIPVTVFAAVSGMSYPVFIISTFISTSAWILFYLLAGKRIGATFHSQIQHYIGLTAAVIVAFTLFIIALHFIGMWRQSRKAKKA